MLYIENDSNNPFFNLALEEYLFKNFTHDIFMLWQNKPCIVVGKNQNTLSEINYSYVKENNLPVVRRLSGGGAVFHDLGNLNFTFIQSCKQKNFQNFKKYTQPILEVLNDLDITAQFSGRNDLTINDKKISGNAQFQDKHRILHHGTLLFASKISDLSKALKPKAEKFENKGVKSVESRVTNISSHLQKPLTISELKELILEKVLSTNKTAKLYELSSVDCMNIEKLVKEKYNTWNWNYGISPRYNYFNTLKFTGGLIEIYLQVERGTILEAKFHGDFFGIKDINEIEKALTNQKHEEKNILNILSRYNLDDYFANISPQDFVQAFFN